MSNYQISQSLSHALLACCLWQFLRKVVFGACASCCPWVTNVFFLFPDPQHKNTHALLAHEHGPILNALKTVIAHCALWSYIQQDGQTRNQTDTYTLCSEKKKSVCACANYTRITRLPFTRLPWTEPTLCKIFTQTDNSGRTIRLEYCKYVYTYIYMVWQMYVSLYAHICCYIIRIHLFAHTQKSCARMTA